MECSQPAHWFRLKDEEVFMDGCYHIETKAIPTTVYGSRIFYTIIVILYLILYNFFSCLLDI